MKNLLITASLLCFTSMAISQSKNTNNLKLKDLSVQPTNTNPPSKPDPKPADVPSVMQSPTVKKASETYEKVGSPKPIMEKGKPIGGSVTKQF